MIRKRLRIQYLFIVVGILVILPLLAFTIIMNNKSLQEDPLEENSYVEEEIITSTPQPVINTITIINPYDSASVKVGKSYYDYQANEENQINSILQHENTYIQNTGIDYVCENEFNVLSILNGTVVNVKEDETVGKTVEIKHDNDVISIYQSLGSINVKKGDTVSQGQIIGTSGTNELEKDLGNHLHFEIYDKGQSVNPENYLNKEIKLEKGN